MVPGLRVPGSSPTWRVRRPLLTANVPAPPVSARGGVDVSRPPVHESAPQAASSGGISMDVPPIGPGTGVQRRLPPAPSRSERSRTWPTSAVRRASHPVGRRDRWSSSGVHPDLLAPTVRPCARTRRFRPRVLAATQYASVESMLTWSDAGKLVRAHWDCRLGWVRTRDPAPHVKTSGPKCNNCEGVPADVTNGLTPRRGCAAPTRGIRGATRR